MDDPKLVQDVHSFTKLTATGGTNSRMGRH